MRIAIDARLNAYRQGGIPQYTRQLLTALAEVAYDDEIISLQHRDQIRPLAIAPNVVRRTMLTPPHHRFEQWALPLELLLARADVLHFPDFIAPLRRPRPAVVTIHDLAFMHYPEILDDAARAYYGQVTTNTPRADAVIAVSEATRQDIAQYLDIPIEQIDVIYEAAAPLYSRMDLRPGEARVLNRTPLAARSFMLFVSTLEPRKNLPTLLRALRVCIDRRPDRPYMLVVAGGRGWRDEMIFQTVRDLQLADYVLFAGSVGQYDLRWLYNACQFYVNPSLYEGFGLPLLEAMACGAACLAAATSSLPEIGGDAAIYLPPLDVGLWAEAIEELWDDEEQQHELGRLGHARSQLFSWARAARETLKVYHRVVERAHQAPARSQMAPAGPLATDALAGSAPTVQLVAAPTLGFGRDCPRCGAELVAGQFQHGLTIERPQASAEPELLEPYAWVCAECGHVVLVVEQATPPMQPTARTQDQEQHAGTGATPTAIEAEDFAPQPTADEAIVGPDTSPDLADDLSAHARELPDAADAVEAAVADPRTTMALPTIDDPDALAFDAEGQSEATEPEADPRTTMVLPTIDDPDESEADAPPYSDDQEIAELVAEEAATGAWRQVNGGALDGHHPAQTTPSTEPAARVVAPAQSVRAERTQADADQPSGSRQQSRSVRPPKAASLGGHPPDGDGDTTEPAPPPTKRRQSRSKRKRS